MVYNNVKIYNSVQSSPKLIREMFVKMLQKEEAYGNVQITRNDDFVLSNGAPVDVLEAKICKGKRGLKFNLHFGGFLLSAKTISLVGSDYLFIGEQSVDLKRVKIDAMDNISISVDY